MATAAHKLRWLVLLATFSAVLRPIWSGRPDQSDYEGTWAGFQRSDGVDGASSVRGLSFPVWCLLVHFGSFETSASRRTIRRMKGMGMLRPARHLLLPHGMITMQAPLETLMLKTCDSQMTLSPKSFLGVGLYFLILLLACQDVERQPGPNDSLDKYVLELKLISLMMQDMREEIKAFDLIDILIKLNRNVIENMEKIEALEAENSKFATRVSELEQQIAIHENERRRNNIVMFGVETESDLNKAIDDVIFKKLSLKKCPKEKIIDKAYRFGKSSSHRPIIIQFKNESDKKRVLNLAPKLRGTEISISDDLTPNERQKKRKIVDAHKMACNQKIKTKVLRNGLLINNEILSLSQLEKSDWMEKYLAKRDDLQQTNETSPSATLSPKKDCPGAPARKMKSKPR